MTHSVSTTFTPPMSEETVEKTSQRMQSSLRDLGIIARELLKGSRSEEALMISAKQFANHETNIESCALNVAKLELLSQQIGLHEECMEQALMNVEDLELKLAKINSRTTSPSKPEKPALSRPKTSEPKPTSTPDLPTG